MSEGEKRERMLKVRNLFSRFKHYERRRNYEFFFTIYCSLGFILEGYSPDLINSNHLDQKSHLADIEISSFFFWGVPNEKIDLLRFRGKIMVRPS